MSDKRTYAKIVGALASIFMNELKAVAETVVTLLFVLMEKSADAMTLRRK